MFCPKCKCEYREGFTRCSDCNISLVDKLAEEKKMKTDDKIAYVEYEYVTTIRSASEIMFLKSILDAEGIIYLLKGEFDPKARKELLVKKEQKEDVLEILTAYNMD